MSEPLECPRMQESLLWEMWTELKFAVNWGAGDTKPIKGREGSRCQSTAESCHFSLRCRSRSRSKSRSMLSKSNAESLNKYGLVGEEHSAKSRKVIPLVTRACVSLFFKDSNYDCFDENAYGEKT